MTGNDECAILVQRILLLAVTLALVIAGVGWFFVSALGRFVILALVLFTVANKINIQPLGLVLGLVTIMVSTVVLGLLRKRERLSGISD